MMMLPSSDLIVVSWAVRGVSRTYFGSSRDMAITERDQNYNRLPVIPIGGFRM